MTTDAPGVELHNDSMALIVDPAHGGRVSFLGPPGGQNSLFVTHLDMATKGDGRFRGGWQSMFPNAGAACVDRGIRYEAHGIAFSAPWTVTAIGSLSMQLEILVAPGLLLRRTIELAARRPSVQIRDKVRNTAEHTLRFSFGQHPTFLATTMTSIDLPADAQPLRRVSDTLAQTAVPHSGPSYRADELLNGTSDSLFVARYRKTAWMATRPSGDGQPIPGVVIAWDVATLPFSWLWLRRQPSVAPDAVSIGMEPVSTDSPAGLHDAVSRGIAVSLRAGKVWHTWTTCVLTQRHGQLAGVARDGRLWFADAPIGHSLDAP